MTIIGRNDNNGDCDTVSKGRGSDDRGSLLNHSAQTFQTSANSVESKSVI